MKFGMMTVLGNKISTERKLELLKKAGFDCFLISLDKKYEKKLLSVKKLKELCDKYDLEISSAHCTYVNEQLNNFWLDNKIGEKILNNYLNDIKTAGENNFKTVVFHLNFDKNCKYTFLGIERLKTMLKLAKEYNVKIAVENISNEHELDFIFSSINDENLGICYDCGHDNFFTPNSSILEKYASKIFALHLHDNDKTSDQHKILFDGNYDFEKFAKFYKLCNNINLDAEVKCSSYVSDKNLTEENLIDFYNKVYASLEKLKAYIENEKQEIV